MSGYTGTAAVSVPLSATGDLGTTGKVNWRHTGGTPYVPSPVLVGENLVFTKQNEAVVTVVNAKTGKAVIEQERLPQARSFYASPITAAGRVYFVDRSGVAIVAKIGDGLDVLSVNKLNDPIDASPVAVGKQLFLRGAQNLYCIETK
jgi:outer membrane protein assembly factor BamB